MNPRDDDAPDDDSPPGVDVGVVLTMLFGVVVVLAALAMLALWAFAGFG